MGNYRRSLAGRTLVQVDCAFWTIHEQLESMIALALPALGVMIAAAVGAILIWRSYEFPGWLGLALGAVILPWLVLLLFTVLPLPGAVFVWKLASGESPTVGDCFARCRSRAGRLAGVVARMSLLWLISLLFLGVPLIVVWPRTCMAPLVALFEEERNVFRRSRRILRQDVAIHVLGGIFLGMAIVLGFLVVTPRLVLGTQALGVHVLDAQWREMIVGQLWIFESLSGAIILTALAMSWWLSLTLLYHEIRWEREGEDLRRGLLAVRAELPRERSTAP